MRHAASRYRVRHGRVAAAAASVLTIAVALMAAVGVLDLNPTTLNAAADDGAGQSQNRAVVDRAAKLGTPSPEPTDDIAGQGSPTNNETPATSAPKPDLKQPLPAGSGSGKRVVYGLAENHVWLVDADNQVVRSYLVSGTRFGQVRAGTYDVLRKKRNTTSYHGTERMEFMVTFTEGENAAIGFHNIPVRISDGQPVQTSAQLGQSLSDGCVRQKQADAAFLWEFAPVGTPVIVLP
jgi:lipoprotein-anchoring transpeptidase ErfK/SrfK